ncbi:threonine aldolase, partial [Mytilus galloprovincialis]
ARRLRKALGGGIRQGGILAAAAMYALDNVLPRLHLDHEHAKELSKGIMASHNDLVNIDLSGVHTNIVFISMMKDNVPSQILHDRLLQITEEEKRELGYVVIVKTVVYSDKLLRFVLHNDVSSDDVELAKKKFQFVLQEIAEKMK